MKWWWRGKFRWFDMPLAERKRTHRAEKDFLVAREALALKGPAGPLRFDPARSVSWTAHPIRAPFVVLHPGTRWMRKRWLADRWLELAAGLRAKGFQIVVSAGPDAEEVSQAAELVEALGGDSVSTAGQAGWSQLAWLLHRARLFVGVDTAAMHLAAACQCPTVALFGPSRPAYWHPWQVPYRLVSPSSAELERLSHLAAEERDRRLMESITVREVTEACEALTVETPDRGRPLMPA